MEFRLSLGVLNSAIICCIVVGLLPNSPGMASPSFTLRLAFSANLCHNNNSLKK
jgi:hypothetical protein